MLICSIAYGDVKEDARILFLSLGYHCLENKIITK